MAKMKKSQKRRERRERRFFPQSSTNPILLRVVGGAGAVLMGAGAWGQFGSSAPEPVKSAKWLLAAGAAVFGMAIWFGTSGDPVVMVGDGGVGVDRGLVQRIPWHAIQKISFDGKKRALVVEGVDEQDKTLTIAMRLKSHAAACAWLVKEAEARVPDVIELTEGLKEEIGSAKDGDGQIVTLDPIQVVGKRCAESDKVIAYEPDARVCPRCERIYHKAHVPEECACGEDLTTLRAKKSEAKKDEEAEA